jgi:hypothetical protein
MRMWLALSAAVLGATPAAAREIVVPVEKGWKHAASGVVLRQPLAGLVRNRLEDSTDGEFDVSANFRSADGAYYATIFIFSSPLPDAGMWFQRASAQITDASRYGTVTPSSAAPLPLVLPGRTQASGYRQAFSATQRVKGTTVAVAEVGTWLVAVRVSSPTMDAAATDAELTTVLEAIRWAATPATAKPLAAVPADCADSLAFGKAKVVKPSGADTLLSAILPLAAASAAQNGEAKEDTRPLCRDVSSTATAGVYRRGGDKNSYTLAIGDAGRTMSLRPNLMALAGKSKAKVSTSLNEVDGRTLVYSSFNALPKPEQALQLLGTTPVSSTKGDDVTLSAEALK